MKKCALFLIVLFLIPMILIGCGSNNSAESNSSAGSDSSEANEPAKEKVLYTCKNYDYACMDPAKYAYYQPFALSEDVYEGLVAFDPDKNIIPRLATDWKISDDYLQYTFTLRKGVKFHKNYGEMKASDVVFTFQRMKDMGADSTAGKEFGIDNIEVKALDDYTVQFTFKKPDPAFLTRMAQWCGFIVSEKAVTELGNDYERNPIGTGPFELVKAEAQQVEEGMRFKDYWGTPPDLDRVVCYYITDGNTMFNAFDSGELDMIYSVDDMKNLEYSKRDDVWIKEFPSPQIRVLSMNCNFKPLDDIRVRQAIFYAINRDDFINNFLQGMQTATSAIVPEGDKYVLKDNFKTEYSPEKAKELLKEAGYPNGFEIVLGVPNDESKNVAVVLQDYLAQVGIKVDVQALEFAGWMDKARAGQWPMWYLGRTSNVLPDTFMKFFMTDFIGKSNFSAYSNPEFDKLCNRAFTEMDEAKRTEAYYEAQRYLKDQYVVYPFYTLTKRAICKKSVSGDIFDPCSTIRFQLVKKEQ
ncbi:MAG: ABC transporter substrate-binding protein [Bacillota bacterium]|jgi:ABC-type transport system substrate-binding protein